MRVQNDLDRFHLVQDVVDRLPHLGSQGRLPEADDAGQAHRAQALHRQHGEDMPEIRNWKWGAAK
jgi:xylulose-5-phosphate/fructose-6-phosphate phosphoketolase